MTSFFGCICRYDAPADRIALAQGIFDRSSFRLNRTDSGFVVSLCVVASGRLLWLSTLGMMFLGNKKQILNYFISFNGPSEVRPKISIPVDGVACSLACSACNGSRHSGDVSFLSDDPFDVPDVTSCEMFPRIPKSLDSASLVARKPAISEFCCFYKVNIILLNGKLHLHSDFYRFTYVGILCSDLFQATLQPSAYGLLRYFFFDDIFKFLSCQQLFQLQRLTNVHRSIG